MEIKPATRRWIQAVLAVAIVVAGARALLIYRARHAGLIRGQPQQQELPLNADYYVIPKKLYAYDLKSAQPLTQMPVWVKEGYRYTYYPYDPAHQGTDFEHPAGLLAPLERLQIKDVVTNPTPGAPGQRQVMAVFDKDGKAFAVPIGVVKDSDYRIYSDEMCYIQDPHQLYQHWPVEIWQAIQNHQVKPGMNELQVGFSIGMGVPRVQNDPEVKTVDYPNGGKPLTITYQNGKAAEIKPGSPS